MRPLLGCVLLAVGCASASSSSTPAAVDDTGTGSTEDTATTTEDTAPACGIKVGDILCDLDLQGYVRDDVTGLATAAPFGPFAKLSDALAKGTQKYAFIFNTAYW